MKYAILTVIAACSILFAGCPATSIQPLFTAKDAVMTQPVEGSWIDAEGNYLRFEAQKNNNCYKAIFFDKDGRSIEYRVFLGEIGGCWFLDSYPTGDYDAHLIPAHMITQIWLTADTMKSAELESDWLSQMIKDNKLSISHTNKGSDVILTASTEELHDLLLKYGSTAKAFPTVNRWARVK